VGVPRAGAERQVDSKHLWKGRNVYLVDGLTFQMPDTAENQAEVAIGAIHLLCHRHFKPVELPYIALSDLKLRYL